MFKCAMYLVRVCSRRLKGHMDRPFVHDDPWRQHIPLCLLESLLGRGDVAKVSFVDLVLVVAPVTEVHQLKKIYILFRIFM